MKVWMLEYANWDEHWVEGIFDSFEKAEAERKAQKDNHFFVEEYEVK